MQRIKDEQIRQAVRKTYGDIAKADTGGCGSGPSSCCGSVDSPTSKDISVGLGYSEKDVSTVPEGSNMGLGCGNPQAIASLKPGETVLDLGSGGGFDCFLAARAVGEKGHVIGIDMTPEMVSKARQNALRTKVDNVEFRLGEIENLPVADNSVDVIISNCVINLSPEKPRVFSQIARVLKPGGQLLVSDIVAKDLPDWVLRDKALYSSCVAGAISEEEYADGLRRAGLENVEVSERLVYDATQLTGFIESDLPDPGANPSCCGG
ncbi:hypothetical protein LCGC14_2674450, partial [marine sediment metagenome]